MSHVSENVNKELDTFPIENQSPGESRIQEEKSTNVTRILIICGVIVLIFGGISAAVYFMSDKVTDQADIKKDDKKPEDKKGEAKEDAKGQADGKAQVKIEEGKKDESVGKPAEGSPEAVTESKDEPKDVSEQGEQKAQAPAEPFEHPLEDKTDVSISSTSAGNNSEAVVAIHNESDHSHTTVTPNDFTGTSKEGGDEPVENKEEELKKAEEEAAVNIEENATEKATEEGDANKLVLK